MAVRASPVPSFCRRRHPTAPGPTWKASPGRFPSGWPWRNSPPVHGPGPPWLSDNCLRTSLTKAGRSWRSICIIFPLQVQILTSLDKLLFVVTCVIYAATQNNVSIPLFLDGIITSHGSLYLLLRAYIQMMKKWKTQFEKENPLHIFLTIIPSTFK